MPTTRTRNAGRGGGSALLLLLTAVAATPARADATRTATFENFAAGSAFLSTFTDPLSGIRFRNPTSVGGGFVVNYSPTHFGAGNYLTTGGIAEGGLGTSLGFTGDLPLPATAVSVAVFYPGQPRSDVKLFALNAAGAVIAQQTGPAGNSLDPFTLQVTAPGYDIAAFRTVVGGGDIAYDDIRYTVLPEPTLLPLFAALTPLFACRRRRLTQ